jgi:transposase-like protein
MGKEKRRFTPEERLSILQEGSREGMLATCRKYNIGNSLYSLWKKKYLQHGINGLKPGYKKSDPQLKALEEENARLKKIIAEQALELEVKNELLKKTPFQIRKK